RALGLSGFSFLVYDHILTFDEEVKFVWQAPWTVTKVTFLANRYGNLIAQGSVHVIEAIHHSSTEQLCRRFNTFVSIHMLLGSESIHILVLLRAWAIWGCERRMAIRLISAYVVYLLILLGMT
ncbi:hypothetical protein BU15DRAFT_15352, partial [Melanogaster broomeanus]